MVLRVGYFGKYNRTTSSILVYGALEGWRSVGPIVGKIKNYYVELRRRVATYIQ